MAEAPRDNPPEPQPPLPNSPPGQPRRSYIMGVVHDTLARLGARLGLYFIAVVAFAAVFAPLLANSHPILMKTADGEVSSPLLEFMATVDVVLLGGTLAGVLLFTLGRRVPIRHRMAALVWVVVALIPLAGWAAVPGLWETWVDYIGALGTGAIAAVVGLVALALLVGIPLLVHATTRFKLIVGGAVAVIGVLLVVVPVDPPIAVVGGYERYREMERQGKIEWAVHTLIPYSPTDRLRDMPQRRLSPPWWLPGKADLPDGYNHWLGTETEGADILSRMIHASRIALAVGFIATSIALSIGVVLGGLMGYFSGTVDLLGMRLLEIFESIPQLYLLLAFVAFFPRGPYMLYFMMAIIGFTSWPGYARFTRAEFLKLRQQDFVQAALACGLPLRSVLFRHMLPNGVAPVLVTASFGVASAILAEAFLSFLGLGLVDEPSWGQMLSQAVGTGGTFSWWIATFPGMAIFLTVFAYNLIGEALRDAIDPHMKKSAHL